MLCTIRKPGDSWRCETPYLCSELGDDLRRRGAGGRSQAERCARSDQRRRQRRVHALKTALFSFLEASKCFLINRKLTVDGVRSASTALSRAHFSSSSRKAICDSTVPFDLPYPLYRNLTSISRLSTVANRDSIAPQHSASYGQSVCYRNPHEVIVN